MNHKHAITCVAWLMLAAAGFAQGHNPRQPGLPLGAAPLLYVRFGGQDGMQVAFQQGEPISHVYATPVVIGMRPGYIYRVKLTNFPGHPGVSLFPTLEVRGTLMLPPSIRAIEHPATVAVSPQEIDRVLAGGFITKVVYLEDPDKAIPVASSSAEPLETMLKPGDDPLKEARERGRPMLIVRLGGRSMTDADLARETMPGIVLLPGQQSLCNPPVQPCVPFACMVPQDPCCGPWRTLEECLKDGGDSGPRAGFDGDGRLRGIDPSDSLAEYKDSKGEKRVTASNRVCLCVPRFAAISVETPIAGYDTAIILGGQQGVQAQVQVRTRQPSSQASQAEYLAGMRSRERASATLMNQGPGRVLQLEALRGHHMDLGSADLLGTEALGRLNAEQRAGLARQLEVAHKLGDHAGTLGVGQVENGPAVVGRVEGLHVTSGALATRDLTIACNELPQVPEKPLVLFKWVDKQAAQIGDIVTFHLKYSNHGGKPITDVAVSDSLTGRLEYIPGSAKSDRDAVFTLQENEAGSLILRWEIGGKLQPGQSGVVKFQARIR